MLNLKRLNELAHLKGDCKGCGGMASDPRTGYVCPTCGGSGKVFVFSEMVRVKCRLGFHSKRFPQDNKCPDCQGRGTVASEKMEDWVEGAHCLGYIVVFQEGECSLFASGDGINLHSLIASGYDPDPFTALVMAIKAVKHEQ